MIKTILPGSRFGEVRIPSSKSIMHRLLICAALGQEKVSIRYDGLSRDIRATADCLNALGADIREGEKELCITPIAEQKHTEKAVLPAGESGSTLRFLIPLAGALGRQADFHMEGRLSERPLAPFDQLLREHGMSLRREGQILHSDGQLDGGMFRLPGNISSQYFSGLLMALPILSGESRLQTEGEMESAAYVQLTEEVLRMAEVRFDRENKSTWKISGCQIPHLPQTVQAEGDWSNAAFFLCAAALSENGIRVGGLNPSSVQGDRQILQILREFGAEIMTDQDCISVRQFFCFPAQAVNECCCCFQPVRFFPAESACSGYSRCSLRTAAEDSQHRYKVRNRHGIDTEGAAGSLPDQDAVMVSHDLCTEFTENLQNLPIALNG